MNDGSLQELYQAHEGKVSDKWQLYLTEYDRLLSGFREDPVHLLEIGVQNGGSLEIWSKYFPKAKAIVGCDIDPRCAQLEFQDERIVVVVGDANSDGTQARILAHSAEFDVVIDDGSHTSSDIVKSFARYFPHVAEGGIYIVEDLHCSYWREFEGGLFDPLSSISFLKSLADAINFNYWGVSKATKDIFRSFLSNYELELNESALQQIHSIEFINSICVIRKSAIADNQLGNRVIAGNMEQVAKGHLNLPKDLDIDVVPQTANFWSSRELPPAEELQIRLQEIVNKANKIADLNQLVEERDAQVLGLNQLVEERDAQVLGLNQLVEERDAQALGLNQLVEERDAQALGLNQLVEERDAQALGLNQLVEERDAQALGLNQLVEERDAQVLELSQLVEARNIQLSSIYCSRSWRLTAPLRMLWKLKNFNEKYYLEQNTDVALSGTDPYEHYIAFGQREGRKPRPPSFLSRFWRVVKALQEAVAVEGGIIPTVGALVSVSKSEGSSGIKARIDAILSRGERNNYAKWIQKYDTLSEENRSRMREQILCMANKPLISILMPVYNTKIEWLKEAIDSVRAQIYENWELCIADDASTDYELRDFLELAAKEDKRIKVIFCKENGHISRASNCALALCSGEWVALMDHDDTLADHALFCVADATNHNPAVKLIYSDEDKIRGDGYRADPYFKCSWNPDLFYSHNMISHLGVYKNDILQKIGGFREGFEGSQDYDLALRYIEQVDQKSIYHIPRVLYHWRAHSESTARDSTAKPYAMHAAKKALQEHFDRRDISATVEQFSFGYRVHYSLPESLPLVTLIIPTRNAMHLLKTCIESIVEKTTYKNYEIIIVDNGSDDPEIIEYFSSLRDRHNIRILRDEGPFNFSRLNNSAVTEAKGEIIGFVNNDIEVISPGWLTELVSIALQPGVGAVGAKLLYPDNTVQHAGVVLGIGGIGSHAFKCQPGNSAGYIGRAGLISSYSALTAACLVIEKEIFLEVEGFDARNLAIAFSDVDFCLRVLESGHRNVWTPYALLYHHESATRGDDDSKEKQDRFASEVQYMNEHWGHQLFNDPAYSPNLTLQHEDFSLAWPPRLKSLVSA